MQFKLRRYYLYYLARSFAFIISVLPLTVGRGLASLAGRLAFWLLPAYRRLTIKNLKSAFEGSKSDREINRIGIKVFENLGKNAAELIMTPQLARLGIDRFVKVRNSEIIDKALKQGKGAIVLATHLGNWDLLALTLTLKGYSGAVLGRRVYFKKYDNYLLRLRSISGLETIYRDESPKKFLKLLRENRILGMLADQDVDSVGGVFVDFFGKPAYTPIGPVALAKASGAALIPTFIIRGDDDKHTIMIEPPVELVDTGNKEADLVENTRRWSAIVESYIRRYPEQWVWMHRRWKTRKS
jgi:KDO2-lipid IV(A) lauroyltransferase